MSLPRIHPEELSKGYLGRIAKTIGCRNVHTLLTSLASLPQLTDAPTELEPNALIAKLTGNTLGSFLSRHTMLPFQRAVSPKKDWRPFAEATEIRAKAAFKFPTGISDVSLLLCHMCVDDDVTTTGSSIWRRNHQLRGIVACPRHKMGLSIVAIVSGSLLKPPHTYLSTSVPIAAEVVQDALTRPVIARYVKFCEMFASRIEPYTTHQLTRTLLHRLWEMEPKVTGKRIRLSKFLGEYLDSPWIKLNFPQLLKERASSNLNSLDQTGLRIDLAYATPYYALALALLFETVEDAYSKLEIPQTDVRLAPMSRRSKDKAGLSDALVPSSSKNDREMAKVLLAFANGASIEEAIIGSNIECHQLLECLREIVSPLKSSIDAIAAE